jgi:hypothetical protein
MKPEDVRSAYKDYTGKASDIVRQLGFAGIALIWLFRTDVGGKPVVTEELFRAGFLIIVALACDLLQYVAGSLVWGIYNRRIERDGYPEDENFTASRRLNWPTLMFFWGKIVCIAAAYFLLGVFVARTVNQT